MASVFRDLRYACRVLRKSPVFTITATATLALCIGANTAIYTVVDRVLLRPLPYPDADRLGQVVTHFDRTGDDETGQTGAAWERLRDGVHAAEFSAYTELSPAVNLVVGDRPQVVKQRRISADFFRVLGVTPILGRSFTAEEDRPNGPAAAIISSELWMRLFSGDRNAIGTAITLRGEPYPIVGVLPRGFDGGQPADVWTPVRPCRTCEGGGQNYSIIARLEPGATWAEADAQVTAAGDALMRDLYRASPARLRLVPLQRGQTLDIRRTLFVLWAAVALVLVIGCVNVAGLLLARASTRAPEIATRIALGGGRAAIVRQLLAESLVLAALGGVGGIVIGYASAQAFATLLQSAFGVSTKVQMDGRVFAIAAAAALVTSLAFGLWPSLQATRVNLREMLVEAGSVSVVGAARNWARRTIVIVEVALGVVLLVAAGLVVRTLDHLLTLRAGFDPSHVMTATLSLQDARYQTPEKVNQLFDRSLQAMRELPGVERAAVCLTLPYERALNVGVRWGDGDTTGAGRLMNLTYVTGEYFTTLRIPLVRGRLLNDADAASTEHVIVVNQEFVRRYSPSRDPIGRILASGGGARRIVGIVGDIQQKAGFNTFGPVAPVPAAYIAAAQTDAALLTMVHTWFSPSWVIRTAGPQDGVAGAMQHAMETVDPLLPFAKFRTVDDVRGEAVATQRAQAWLLGTFAVVALLLAAIGLYGLVANTVTERTRELGVRIALGASMTQAVWAAALPGCALGAIGVAIGVVLARGMGGLLRHMVWGVSVADGLTFATASAAVLAVAVAAAVVPALRVVRLTPIRALRAN